MTYTVKDDLIFWEFVKCGVNYIENKQITVNLSQVDTTGTDNKYNSIFPDWSKAKMVDKNSVDKPRSSKLKKKRKLIALTHQV